MVEAAMPYIETTPQCTNEPAMQSITMPPELVHAAIAGHDLGTFNGWTSAAIALLQDKPARTALKDASNVGYMVLIEGDLIAVPANEDGSLTYVMDGDFPVGSCDVDPNAWNSERQCWDCSNPDQDTLTLTAPVFVTLVFVPAQA